ncbi:MAG TPA: cupin domain-containing protein [Thermoplasmata archaeon]|jgi:mannose-6-phosphate isomerase-like protein (cupin superfamily)|nr:cupin domain-containing protein [Thermoplasmata archaeon]
MKVVQRSKAKALKGNKSLSYQIVGPEATGARKFMITVVDVRPGGSTPLHEHRTVDSMYYIIEGRAEVTDGKETKRVGPDVAIFFPAGGSHGIRNVGRTTLRYLSCHAPPYEIEELYRSWRRAGKLVTTGG